MVKPKCAPKLREVHTAAAALLPLLKEGTPSVGGTREKTKSPGRWSSLFQMRATSLSPIPSSKQILLEYILKNWKKFDLHTLLKKHMIFFCTKAWPQFDPSDGEKWPPEGSLNYNAILQLDLFCRWQGKWSQLLHKSVFSQDKENLNTWDFWPFSFSSTKEV